MTLSAFEQQLIQELRCLAPAGSVLAGLPDPLHPPAAATLFLHLDGLDPQPPAGESPAQRRQPVAASLLTALPIPAPQDNGAPVSLPLPPRDSAAYPRLVEVFTPAGRLLPIPDACGLDPSGTHLLLRSPPAADRLWLRWEANRPCGGYREACEARLGLRLAACAPEADTAESLLLAALALLLRSVHQRELILLQPALIAASPASVANPVPFLLQLRQPLPILGGLQRDPLTATPAGPAVAGCRQQLWLQGTLDWALLGPESTAGSTIQSVRLQGDPLLPLPTPSRAPRP